MPHVDELDVYVCDEDDAEVAYDVGDAKGDAHGGNDTGVTMMIMLLMITTVLRAFISMVCWSPLRVCLWRRVCMRKFYEREVLA